MLSVELYQEFFSFDTYFSYLFIKTAKLNTDDVNQIFYEKKHMYIVILARNNRKDVIDYIEMFYNSRRRHGFNEMLSPVEYEK